MQQGGETRSTPLDGASVREAEQRLEQDLMALREAAARRAGQLFDEARRFVDEHPLAAVGVAFGTGYLLSGALFSRATMRLVSVGARIAAGRMLRTWLTSDEPAVEASRAGVAEPVGPAGMGG